MKQFFLCVSAILLFALSSVQASIRVMLNASDWESQYDEGIYLHDVNSDTDILMTHMWFHWFSYTYPEEVTSASFYFKTVRTISGYKSTTIDNISQSSCYSIRSDYGYIFQDMETGQLVYSLEAKDCPEIETLTLRLNPYSTNWEQVYLIVGMDIGDDQIINATINPLDGWYTAQVDVIAGDGLTIFWSNSEDWKPSEYRYNVYGSVCFEIKDNSLEEVEYKSLLPNESNSFTINVTTPGTFAQLLLQQLGDLSWSDVVALIVTGSLNESDMAYFSRLSSLQELDLSGADITSVGGCKELKRLNKVVLPNSCITINDDAFSSCQRLSSINLENIESVGANAFYENEKLTSIRMPKLREIKDGAFSNTWRGNGGLQDIYMPLVETIGNAAFYCQSKLMAVSFPALTSIGEHAFYSCNGLTTISCPIVLEIGRDAFKYCENLASVTIPLVNSIGESAFEECHALVQVDISNITKLGNNAFKKCSNLTQVTLSNELRRIPSECFQESPKLTSITLPKGLTEIGSSALPYISGNVQLPNTVTRVDNNNFNNATSITIPANITYWNSFSSSWKDIYNYLIVPLSIDEFKYNKDRLSSITLHVPSISLATYKLDENWYHFGKILPIDGDVSELNINGAYTLLSTTGLSEKVNVTLLDKGALTVDANNTLSVGNYIQYIFASGWRYKMVSGTWTSEYEDWPNDGNISYTGRLLANSTITADNVTAKLMVRSDAWNFFSLPFDVNMSDITVPDGEFEINGTPHWVIREYSGANRASGSGATWNNVPTDGILKAHTGYILYYTIEENLTPEQQAMYDMYGYSYGGYTCYFNMPAIKNANQQNIFATNDVTIPLMEYSAEFPQNRSWNLVGNPYPCSFSIKNMDFSAPITTWNGVGYVAYSIEDDNFMLRPAEAFFVQAPQGVSQITFHKEGRELNHVKSSAPQPRSSLGNNPRKVFNFILSNDDYSDRARLVLNDQASAEYEITCDAAKMMSSDMSVPQVFVNDNGLHYAIDERPEASSYVLGAFFGKGGDYTLHLNLPHDEERQVLLTDTEAHTTADLTLGDYIFTTEAGTFESRFIITFAPKMPTGIDGIQGDNLQSTKYLENGQLIIVNPQGKKFTVGGCEL